MSDLRRQAESGLGWEKVGRGSHTRQKRVASEEEVTQTQERAFTEEDPPNL